MAQTVKNPPAMQETWVRSLGQEDPLEKEMAIHSSILTWRIPWTEEPGGLQSTGSQRVRHDWVTNTAHLELSLIYLGFRKILVKHLSFSHPWWSELQTNSQKRKKKGGGEGGAQWAYLGPSLPSDPWPIGEQLSAKVFLKSLSVPQLRGNYAYGAHQKQCEGSLPV